MMTETQRYPLWLREPVGGLSTGFAIDRVLARHKSQYQDIAIYETATYGRMMVLDDCFMLTERDEFLYHEMLVHPAACCHPMASSALVIGGGDGGTVRELLRHENLTSIELVELDGDVVRLSKEYLPTLSKGLDDPRVNVHIADGVAYLKAKPAQYDLIMVDSTDPVGPAAGLITRDFYALCKEALRPGGILTLQSESPMAHLQEVTTIMANVGTHFHTTALYTAPVITYPSGWWSFVWASNDRDPKADLNAERAQTMAATLQYYNQDIHHGAFALPNFVKSALAKAS